MDLGLPVWICYLSKNADFMHTMSVAFTSLLAFANTVLPGSQAAILLSSFEYMCSKT